MLLFCLDDSCHAGSFTAVPGLWGGSCSDGDDPAADGEAAAGGRVQPQHGRGVSGELSGACTGFQENWALTFPWC